MTAKTRADIQTEITALLANNTTGDISPTDVRTVHETSKDSNLNLLDAAGTQVVAGTVNYTGLLQVEGAKVDPLLSTVVVNAAGDLPTPSAGEIQLASNTTYLLAGVITIADSIVPGVLSSITSLSNVYNELKYTGTGSMFKGANKSFSVSMVGIRCAAGTLNDWTDTAPLKDSVIEYDRCIFHEIDKGGLCTDVKQIRYFACVLSDIKTVGFTYAGDIGQIFSVDTDYVNNSPTPVHNLGTVTSDLIWHIDYQAELLNASGSWLSGLAADGNLNAGGTGQVLVGLHTGPGTDLVGISQDDPSWNFQDINRLANTRPDGLLSMQGNATNTVIAAPGTPVLIAGTFVVESTSQATGTAAGRITYDATKSAKLPIDGSITVVPVSGGAVDVSVEVALGGSVIAASKRTGSASSGNPINITIPWQLTFATTNYIELFVTNEDSTAHLLVSSATLRLN